MPRLRKITIRIISIAIMIGRVSVAELPCLGARRSHAVAPRSSLHSDLIPWGAAAPRKLWLANRGSLRPPALLTIRYPQRTSGIPPTRD